MSNDLAANEAVSAAAGEAALCADEPISDFDGIIRDVRALEFRDALCTERDVRAADVPLVYGDGAGGGMIMRRDIGVELGGGNAATCAMVLPTSDVSLVRDGRVTIVGSDACALSPGDAAPFAQIILVGGSDLVGSDAQVLVEAQKVRNWVRGYQVRTTTDEIAARVSIELMEQGFSLMHLGRALIDLMYSLDDRVESVEVIYVTSSSEDVRAFRPLARQWVERSYELRRSAMAKIGIDIDCSSGGHCGKCKDKNTCDQVRRIQAMRRTTKQTAA